MDLEFNKRFRDLEPLLFYHVIYSIKALSKLLKKQTFAISKRIMRRKQLLISCRLLEWLFNEETAVAFQKLFLTPESWMRFTTCNSYCNLITIYGSVLQIQFERAIFQTFWRIHSCAKFLSFELETSNFGSSYVFLSPLKWLGRFLPNLTF